MKQGKRWIALMLALAMCLSVLPANVLATELGGEAEAVEVAAPEDTSEAAEAEEPQAARLRARVPARATEISFFIVGVSFSCVFSCVNVLVPAVMSLNKYSGTFAHRAVCRS